MQKDSNAPCVLCRAGRASGNSQQDPKRVRGEERGEVGQELKWGQSKKKKKELNAISGSVSLGEHQQAAARTRVCPFSVELVLGLNRRLEGAVVDTGRENVPDFLGKIRRGESLRRRGEDLQVVPQHVPLRGPQEAHQAGIRMLISHHGGANLLQGKAAER